MSLKKYNNLTKIEPKFIYLLKFKRKICIEKIQKFLILLAADLARSATLNPSTDVKRVMSGNFFNKITRWGKLYPSVVADGDPAIRGGEDPIRFKSFEYDI